ncbi:MAG: ClpXP protease specificity-enhancing factor [Pseudomonadota bacterium]
MISSRPYLIRALYDWIVDSDLTPYLLADATLDGVEVPAKSVSDGRIVLNVAPHAVTHLVLGNDAVTFSARFSGASFPVTLPVSSVLAVYAKENGHGMMFSADEPGGGDDGDDNGDSPGDGESGARNHLKVIK